MHAFFANVRPFTVDDLASLIAKREGIESDDALERAKNRTVPAGFVLEIEDDRGKVVHAPTTRYASKSAAQRAGFRFIKRYRDTGTFEKTTAGVRAEAK